jgi:hypothetical protein
MQFKKTATFAALALTALTVGTALPAHAGPGGVCGPDRVCLYENVNYNESSGDHWRDITGEDSDLRNNHWKDRNGTETSDGMDNETSSVKTRGCYTTLYQDPGFSGAQTHFNNYIDDSHLSDNPIGDNRTSAIKLWC